MTANIFISGPIGFPPGEVAGEVGTTLMDVRRQMDSFGPGITQVNVFINSPGGDVAEGFAIYDYLRALDATVTTIGEGMVYSIASVIFMAGSKREMYANAELFLHPPLAGLFGNASDMREAANYLDAARDKIVNTYLQAANGNSREDVLNMMETETYLNAEDAIRLGFATGIYSMKLEPVAWHSPITNNNSDMDEQTRKGFLAEIREVINGAFKSAKNEVVEPAPDPTPDPVDTSELEAELEAAKAELAALKAEKESTVEKVAELEAVNLKQKEDFTAQLQAINAKLEELESTPAVAAPPRTEPKNQGGTRYTLPENLADKDSAFFDKLKKYA